MQRRTFFDSQEDAHGARRTVSLNRNPSNGGGEKGIGIVFGRPEVGTDDGGASLPYTIHRVSRDGTAFQSGLIHEGDLLMKVNGASVADMTGIHCALVSPHDPTIHALTANTGRFTEIVQIDF